MYLVCRLLLALATTEIYTLSLHDALPISRCANIQPANTEEELQLQKLHLNLSRSRPLLRCTGTGENYYLCPRRRWECLAVPFKGPRSVTRDRKSTRLNSSHRCISYAVFCLL